MIPSSRLQLVTFELPDAKCQKLQVLLEVRRVKGEREKETSMSPILKMISENGKKLAARSS